jgi:F-type H+-transporting ATPase subunit b
LKTTRKKYLIPLTLCVGFLVILCCPDAFAAGELGPGRRLWNNIMLWVNFGILAFFFFRYAKKPLMDYLRGERQKIEENLNTTDGQLRDVKTIMDQEGEKLRRIDERLQEIRNSVTEIGRREKEMIIKQAKIAAEKMVRDAEVYANYRLAMARKALSDEMVDMAISMVEARLKTGISDEDNERIIDEFVMDLESSTESENS